MDIQRIESSYPSEKVQTGIVHIGLGAFHRAHQSLFLERWLDKNGGGPWGICSANIRSNQTLVEVLDAQECRYHVASYHDAEHVTLNEVRAIREVLFAGESKQELLERLTAEATRIVTLTVTEKGYCVVPAERRLRIEDPAIQHDIANPAEPKTVPGILLEALVRRREQGIAPFTVLSCDNMPDNGEMTREAVVQLAASRSAELAAWIEDSVAFPCSMVDQIVPAMDLHSAAKLKDDLGCTDPAAVVTEAFSQWVVEDNFPMGRPDWESVGVEMVADVRPFETMKLRLLNGSHSLLAYLGCLDGWGTVAEAVSKPEAKALLQAYMAEAVATLELPDTVNTQQYCDSLLERFANDSLNHRLQQIAMDGSQKILQRWLQGLQERLSAGLSTPIATLGVAAWIHYTRGEDFHGQHYAVSDPLAEQFVQLHQNHRQPEALIEAFLAIRQIFPAALAQSEAFKTSLHTAYCLLQEQGVLPTMLGYLEECQS